MSTLSSLGPSRSAAYAALSSVCAGLLMLNAGCSSRPSSGAGGAGVGGSSGVAGASGGGGTSGAGGAAAPGGSDGGRNSADASPEIARDASPSDAPTSSSDARVRRCVGTTDRRDAGHQRRVVGPAGQLLAGHRRRSAIRRVLRRQPHDDGGATHAGLADLDADHAGHDAGLGQPQPRRARRRQRGASARVGQHARRSADLLSQHAPARRQQSGARDRDGRHQRAGVHLPAVLSRPDRQPGLRLPRRRQRQRQLHLRQLGRDSTHVEPPHQHAAHRRAEHIQRVSGRAAARPRRLLSHRVGLARHRPTPPPTTTSRT